MLRLSSFPSDVRSVPLAGLTTQSTSLLSAADTVLVGIGKLQGQVALKAPISSPVFTGNVTIPAGSIDNTVIGANTATSAAFTALSASGPVSGVGFITLLAPYLSTASAANTYQPLLTYTPYDAANPSGYQTASQVSATVTAAMVASVAGVASFNSRTGAISLTSSDVTTALSYTPYNATNPLNFQTAANVTASIAAAAYTLPTASTSVIGGVKIDGTTVTIASGVISVPGSGVSSFNTRTGAVTLSSTDVTTALKYFPYNSTNPQGYQMASDVATTLLAYAPLASPTLTGTPRVPTASAGSSTTQIASTAFVTAAVAGCEQTANKGASNGYAPLDATARVPFANLPAALGEALFFAGTWNAATNTPTLTSGTGTNGATYVVTVAGTTTLDGVSSWNVGDKAVFDGITSASWQKIDGQAVEVVSVAGRTGAVVLGVADVTGAAPLASPIFTGAVSLAVVPLTFAATITPNAALGNYFSVTLTGNATLANPSNLVAGTQYQFIISQDASGSRTLAYGSAFKFANMAAPTLTTAASAVDVLTCFSPDGLSLYGVLSANFG